MTSDKRLRDAQWKLEHANRDNPPGPVYLSRYEMEEILHLVDHALLGTPSSLREYELHVEESTGVVERVAEYTRP